MVQFFETEGDNRLGQLGQALGQFLGGQQAQQKEQGQSATLSKVLFGNEDMANLSPEQQIALAKTQQKTQEFEQKKKLLEKIFGHPVSDEEVQQPDKQEAIQQPGKEKATQTSDKGLGDLSNEEISLLGAYDPNLARIAQSEKKQNLKTFENERKYHTQVSDKYIENINNKREALPQKTRALKFARDAIESGEVGAFSLSRLGESIGGPIGDALQSAKGAQLVTASKENLLGNLGRVSARAQNRWMEERINSMFGKVGQTEEANLSAQELLEGETLLEKANIAISDSLVDQDVEETGKGELSGYAKRDIQKRVSKTLEPIDDIIQERTSYRLREIYEQEKGMDKLREEVGKKVPKGTPLTLSMRNLYRRKFGDKYEEVAKKNGFTIPSKKEYQIFNMGFEEFGKKLGIPNE